MNQNKITCDECEYMINYEDQDKWSSPIACGKCGRLKTELIKLQNIEEE